MQREIESDPEAAQEIRRYLALADAALAPEQLFLVERRYPEHASNPENKRAA